MTNDTNNPELIELLSAYLDNELTELQQEKVRQLINSDAQVRLAFETLQKTAKAVSALPFQSVPRDLSDDVLYALERDTLLDGNDDSALMVGERHLRIRNFVGAAVILILVSVVFVVIYSVIKPGEATLPTEQVFVQIEPENMTHDAGSDKNKIVKLDSVHSFDQLIVNSEKEKSVGQVESLVANTSQAKTSEPVITNDPSVLMLMANNQENADAGQLEIPTLNYSNIKLETEIAPDDSLTLDKLRYFASRNNGEFFSSGQRYTLALVCRVADFEKLYLDLRDNLPGSLNLRFNATGNYKSVLISNVTATELLKIAGTNRDSERLTMLMAQLPAERIIAVKKVNAIEPPLWQQMSTIVPESQQKALAEIYQKVLEPYALVSQSISTNELQMINSFLTSSTPPLTADSSKPVFFDTAGWQTPDLIALEVLLYTVLQEKHTEPEQKPEPEPSESLPVEARIQFGPMLK